MDRVRHHWLLTTGLIAAGCAGGLPPLVTAPPTPRPAVGVVAKPVAGLSDVRESPLLAFESPADLVFVEAVGGPAAIEGGGLRVGAGVRSVRVRLSSLLLGRAFPDRWTLLAWRWRGTESVVGTALLRAGGAGSTAAMRGGATWGRHAVDLTGLHVAPSAATTRATTAAPDGDALELRIDFAEPLDAPAWLDDLRLVDNDRTYAAGADGWQVRRHGPRWAVTFPDGGGWFDAGPTPQVDGGAWALREATPYAATFERPGGQARTIDRRGREVVGGRMRAVGPAEAYAEAFVAQHAAPGRLEADGVTARVDRSRPGDADDDGYDEQAGTYRVIANGPRVELRFEPAVPTRWPAIEITGLPAGEVVATVDGTLVERAYRCADGRVMLELPGVIGRPVTVLARVR